MGDGIRIDKNEFNNRLNTEINALNDESSKAEKQVDTMANFSPEGFGLTGDGYQAFRDLVNGRATIAKAHYVFFQRIIAADEANRGAMTQVKDFADDNTVNTARCQQRIDDARSEITSINGERSQALSTSGGGTTGSNFGDSQLQATEDYYQGLIDAQNQIIQANQEAIDSVATYQTAVNEMYGEAETLANSMLQAATNAIANRISNGSYGDMSWADGQDGRYSNVNDAYDAAQIRADLMPNGEINADKVRELFGKDNLTDAEKRALGMIYADLISRAQAGDNGPLNAFLNLGYQQTGQDISHDVMPPYSGISGATTYTATFTQLPGFKIALASWADDSYLPVGIPRDRINSCDATAMALIMSPAYTRSAEYDAMYEQAPHFDSNIQVSFSKYTPTHKQQDKAIPDSFHLETIAFGNDYESHATYDSSPDVNADEMSVYLAEQGLEDPKDKAIAKAGKGIFSGITGFGFPVDAQSSADSILSALGKGVSSTSMAGIGLTFAKAGVDGLAEYYKTQDANKELITIGNVNDLSTDADVTFRDGAHGGRGGVVANGDGVAVQAGSPTQEQQRAYAKAWEQYEAWAEDHSQPDPSNPGSSKPDKTYTDWLNDAAPGSSENNMQKIWDGVKNGG